MKQFRLAASLVWVFTLGNAVAARAQALPPKIEKQAAHGDLKALNRAFDILAHADGGDAESIVITIGKSITRSPKNFLKAYKGHHKKAATLVDSLVGALGEDYVDRMADQKKELSRRIKALKRVNDADLQAVKAECLSELEKRTGASSN